MKCKKGKENGNWYVLGGELVDGEDNWILLSCGRGPFKGETYESTENRFAELMSENNFEMDEFGQVLNLDAPRFKKTMREAGWLETFILIGP